MGDVARAILTAVRAERFAFSVHATIRLRQRRIRPWQVIAGTLDGILIVERPESPPNPIAEFEITLPDGVRAKAVWAWLPEDDSAKLVTIHLFDR